MLLAEALIMRKELKTRITDFSSRLQAVAVMQEGDTPFENPLELLAQLDQLLSEYEVLITRIHQTNLLSRLTDGRSIMAAIVARDSLDERMAVLRTVAQAAGGRNDRYAHTEIRYVTTLDVASIRKDIDRCAQQRRQLDTAIQRANWQYELVEVA